MTADWLLALLDLALVVAVAGCGGRLAVRIGQPRIAGELVAVVAIGPTVLGGQIEGVVEGAGATGAVGALFPPVAVDVLGWGGGLGLMLYMLLVGMTIDAGPTLRSWRSIALIGVAVVASSGLLAIGVSAWLAADAGWQAPGASAAAFALALAAAFSAQGVPVTARILEERGLLRSGVGVAVIATGAFITTVALVMSGVAIKGADAGTAMRLIPIPLAFVLLVVAGAAIVRGSGVRLPRRVAVAVVIAAAVGGGVVGQSLIGTALLGPLVVGVLVSAGGSSATFIDRRLGRLVRTVLLPIFLGVAALHTNLREIGLDGALTVAAVLAAVIATKLAAGLAAARASGFTVPAATAVGVLLQCGGIMTIAISLEQLDGGVITTRMHAALTLLGLVTTVITGPVLNRVGERSDALAPAPSAA